jgi:hypothetical protein
MKLHIKGAGAWGRGFTNADELAGAFSRSEAEQEPAWASPAPSQIPQRERRRAPLLVKLAVAVAHQACEQAGAAKAEIASVFCSSMGDSDITDYMCRTLAGASKVLSPTKFHNSVHNAPAGYWSISAQNRAPSSSVACGRESFPAALLEAAVLAVQAERPVLLVAADVAVEGPLSAAFPIDEPFAAAIVLDPAPGDQYLGSIALRYASGSADWPRIAQPRLRAISEGNPSARCLALFEALAMGADASLTLPLSDGAHLTLDVTGQL